MVNRMVKHGSLRWALLAMATHATGSKPSSTTLLNVWPAPKTVSAGQTSVRGAFARLFRSWFVATRCMPGHAYVVASSHWLHVGCIPLPCCECAPHAVCDTARRATTARRFSLDNAVCAAMQSGLVSHSLTHAMVMCICADL
jgi:hypothetical protein